MYYLSNVIEACLKVTINLYKYKSTFHIFPSKVCHFQYHYRFLFNRELGNIRACKEVRMFKNEESFEKSFSFSFSAKCFDRNFKYFLPCTIPFLYIMKFEDSKHIKRYIFHYFFFPINSRGGICILKVCL